MQYRPVTIDGHRHQAEDADSAQDHENRHGEETGVQIRWQANAREDRERDREQSDQEIGRRQRDNVVVGAPTQLPLLAEDDDHQAVAENGADRDQDLADGVGQVQLRAYGRRVRRPGVVERQLGRVRWKSHRDDHQERAALAVVRYWRRRGCGNTIVRRGVLVVSSRSRGMALYRAAGSIGAIVIFSSVTSGARCFFKEVR